MAMESVLAQRLRTARGHLDAISRMVEEEERDCVDVLHQLSAVQGALAAARRDLLEQRLRECLETAPSASDVDDLVDQLLTATFGGPAGRS